MFNRVTLECQNGSLFREARIGRECEIVCPAGQPTGREIRFIGRNERNGHLNEVEGKCSRVRDSLGF
jgi:hypothetical protein